jgi:hypothetical protein
MSKLGYTWYPKDWGNSESVFELNLTDRGLYRELIDLAMLNDNKTEIKLEVWSRKFAIEIDSLNFILNKLTKLNLIKINGENLFIPSCESRLNLVRGGRKGGKKSKPIVKPIVKPFESLEEKNEKPIANQIENKLNIKEKEIKNKKENEEETATPLKFSFFNSLIDYGFEKNLVNDWLQVRKTKKASNTETAFKSFIKEIQKRNSDINQILELIVSKNWISFKWEWYDNEKKISKEPEKTIDFDAFLNFFKSIYNNCRLKNIPEATKKRFLELLEVGYTKEDLIFSIKNSYKDEYNRDKINIETFSFSGGLEKYLNFKEDKL